jgi:2',3'-cyclic-nucleotide 2'-phosphodiesterase (5'-nucleotidase family)
MRLVAAAALALGALAGCARRVPNITRPAPAVRLLLVNDVYSADTLRDGTGGLARVATLRDSLARSGPVLFFLAGDVLSPSLLSKWYAGQQMVEAFNAARLDYATFGNHEFELERDTLLARLRSSRFRWLSANCARADGTPFPGVARWDTVTLGGVRVGIFGLTLQGDYRSYVRCGNADSAAMAATRALRSAGAEVVVALTHQFVSEDSALLLREPGIDLVLGGHEHEVHRVDVGGRLVLKADANARSTQVVSIRRDATGRPRTADTVVHVRRPLAFQPATAAVVRAWADSLLARIGPERVIGTAPVALDARDFVSRAGESALGDLAADGMRLGTNADVALLNAGSMRIDDMLGPGPITNYELESIFLFPDETRAVTFPLSGARLRALLEHGVSARNLGRGGFLQLSGVRFRFDPSRPTGARIVGDVLRADGSVLQPTDTLRVTFVGYPACNGGDGFQVPEAAEACARLATAPRTVDLLREHVAGRLGGTFVVPSGGRVVRVGGA